MSVIVYISLSHNITQINDFIIKLFLFVCVHTLPNIHTPLVVVSWCVVG